MYCNCRVCVRGYYNITIEYSYVADTASVAEETNPAAIERAAGVKVLAVVPRDLQTNVHKGVVGPGVLFALGQIDYDTILS